MSDLDLNRIAVPLQWPAIFGRSAPVDIEIGSGKGKFLLDLASMRPERDILAVERAGKYHRLCCERAAKRGIENVRLLRTSAEDLLFRLLEPATVESIFILFPDPWPKKRHHKRRLINADVVTVLNQALIPGGRLMIKTDHQGYSEVISGVLGSAAGFTTLDPEEAFAGLPLTGFENKYRLQGRPIYPFALQKNA